MNPMLGERLIVDEPCHLNQYGPDRSEFIAKTPCRIRRPGGSLVESVDGGTDDRSKLDQVRN